MWILYPDSIPHSGNKEITLEYSDFEEEILYDALFPLL